MTDRQQVRLVGELGPDDAVFGIADEEGYIHNIRSLRREKYGHLVHAVEDYLKQVRSGLPTEICFAVASPVSDDRIEFTNSPWRFSVYATRQRLKTKRIEIINDFTARALSIPYLPEKQIRKIGTGTPLDDCPVLVIGPEIGLGVSGLVPNHDQPIALATEGGHTSFAPGNEMEIELLKILWKKHEHLSAEKVISLQGLPDLHAAVCEYAGEQATTEDPQRIIDQGLRGTCQRSRETLRVFCHQLGSKCADAALTLGAKGGVYLVSSVVTKIADFMIANGFRKRFEAKGRFKDYLKQIPTYVVIARNPALIGAAAKLGVTPKRTR